MKRKTLTAHFSPTVSLVLTALFAALIALCSWISIPLTVPFTLQTFAVFCTLLVLGGQYGTLAVTVYLLLGAIGVPVFAGFKGGIGALFGTTGGYLLGFLITALFYWLVTALCGEKLVVRVISLVVGHLLCLAFGTMWFMMVYTRQSGPVGVLTALGWCVIPFLIPDAAKLLLALFVSGGLKKRLRF